MAVAYSSFSAKNGAELELVINDAWSTLTSLLLTDFGFLAKDEARRLGVELAVILRSDPTGGVVMTSPYQVKVFEGQTIQDVEAQAQDFLTTNPTYFISNLFTQDLGTERTTGSYIGLVIYNADAAGGLANYQVYSNWVGAATDEFVKVSGADLVQGYLSGKLAAGANIAFAILNPGANEQLQINGTAAGIGGAIAATQVAYGTGVNTIGGNANFTYNSTTNVLTLNQPSTSGTWMEWSGPGNPWQWRRSFGLLRLFAGTAWVDFNQGTGRIAFGTNHEVDIDSLTPSTSSTTGALVVGGGVGIGGDLYVGTDNILTGRSIHVAGGTNPTSNTARGVHLFDSGFGGAGSVGGIVLSQGSISERRLYWSGNDGGFYFHIGSFSTSQGELQISQDQVGVAGQLRLSPDGTRAVRTNNGNTGLRAEVGTDAGAFTANADTDGLDTYIYSQSGGAHAAANPRGGDIIVTPGLAGAGGTGRDGIFKVDGAAEVTGKLTVGGLIDPTGLELTPVAANPGGAPANTIWLNNANSKFTFESGLAITATTFTTGFGTGAFTVGGGASINNGLYVGGVGIFSSDGINISNIITAAGIGQLRFGTYPATSAAILDWNNTRISVLIGTASTNPTTGAFVVTGGVGVGGAINVGNTSNPTGNPAFSGGSIATAGGIGAQGRIWAQDEVASNLRMRAPFFWAGNYPGIGIAGADARFNATNIQYSIGGVLAGGFSITDGTNTFFTASTNNNIGAFHQSIIGQFVDIQKGIRYSGFLDNQDLSAGNIQLDRNTSHVEITTGDVTNQLRAWANPNKGDSFKVRVRTGGTSAIVADSGGTPLEGSPLADGATAEYLYNGTLWIRFN